VVLRVIDSLALRVGLDVAKVPNVADFVSGAGVGLAEGVVVGACGHAAVGKVAEFVDVEAVESWGEASDLCLDAHLLSNLLDKLDGASDAGRAVEY